VDLSIKWHFNTSNATDYSRILWQHVPAAFEVVALTFGEKGHSRDMHVSQEIEHMNEQFVTLQKSPAPEVTVVTAVPPNATGNTTQNVTAKAAQPPPTPAGGTSTVTTMSNSTHTTTTTTVRLTVGLNRCNNSPLPLG
jgi:hypothetical protein